MGELRDRMVRDMDLRNFSPRTVESYVEQVKGLAKYYRRSPDQLSIEDIQQYMLYVREQRRLSTSTFTHRWGLREDAVQFNGDFPPSGCTPRDLSRCDPSSRTAEKPSYVRRELT